MPRRGGIAGIKRRHEKKEAMAAIGDEVSASSREELGKIAVDFRDHLHTFAVKHKDEINKNPHFRRQFHTLCQTTGVDPLASAKSFWGELLGMNDFYYELAVQAVEVCLRKRSVTGGLLKMSYLHGALSERRGKYKQEVAADDVERAIGMLGVLGSGYQIVQLRGETLVQSVPCEMSGDHTQILEMAQEPPAVGLTTASAIQERLHWSPQRTEAALTLLQRQGMAWLDAQADEDTYYFPSLWPQFAELS